MARQTHARGLDWQMFIMPFDCRARLRGRLPASRPRKTLVQNGTDESGQERNHHRRRARDGDPDGGVEEDGSTKGAWAPTL